MLVWSDDFTLFLTNVQSSYKARGQRLSFLTTFHEDNTDPLLEEGLGRGEN